VRERSVFPEKVDDTAATVAELVDELRAAGERYECRFSDLAGLSVAGGSQLTDFDASLKVFREVAFSADDRGLG